MQGEGLPGEGLPGTDAAPGTPSGSAGRFTPGALARPCGQDKAPTAWENTPENETENAAENDPPQSPENQGFSGVLTRENARERGIIGNNGNALCAGGWNAGLGRAENKAGASSELRALAAALQRDLSPAAEALRLLERLPQLLPDDPEMAAILEEALTEAFAAGQARLPDGQAEKPEAAPEETPEAENTAANSTCLPDRQACRAEHPETCRVHGLQGSAPGQGQREPETKAVKDSLGAKFDSEHPERYTVTDNIARGKKALTRALAHKGTVRDAMYRPECGSIDFEWGTPGDKARDWAGGSGISHAFAKHPGDIQKLPEIIAKGEAYKVKSKNEKGEEGYHGRIVFILGDGAVFVDPAPKGKGTFVTGYRKRDDGGFPLIEKNPKA